LTINRQHSEQHVLTKCWSNAPNLIWWFVVSVCLEICLLSVVEKEITMKKQDNLPPQMQEWLDQLHHYRDIYSYKPSPEEAAEVKLIGKQIRELRERAKLTMLGVKMLTGIDVALLQAVEMALAT
jgi:DNA-binding ferritin-like protein (Dps family)